MKIVGFDLDEGRFIAVFTKLGLSRLFFPGAAVPRPSRTDSSGGSWLDPRWVEGTLQALRGRLTRRKSRDLPPLDLSEGTAFQQSVWRALLGIPVGKTCSYSEIAARVGRPNAARAVGAACGANPIPILVPCHRVITAVGGLGGFSGGLDWKIRLLQREGSAPGFQERLV